METEGSVVLVVIAGQDCGEKEKVKESATELGENVLKTSNY